MGEEVHARPLVDAATEASLVEEYTAIAAEVDTCVHACKACSAGPGFMVAYPAFDAASDKMRAFVLRTHDTPMSFDFRIKLLNGAIRMSACTDEIHAIGNKLYA